MRIALATCERPIERDHDFDHLAPALRRRGAVVEAPAWSAGAVDWAGFDLVVPNSTWDYHERPDEFRDWLRAAAAASRLRNPLELVEWNLDKRYLRELERAGVPTIPTVWSEPGGEEAAAARAGELGSDEVIVKPAVDLGAMRLSRVHPERVAEMLGRLGEPALCQPYLRSLERIGELSLLYVAGELLHAVRKRPAAGDFRVQPQYGGRHEPLEPPPAARKIAAAAIAAAPGATPLYARVDLVLDDGGGLRLIELELIEPLFYIDAAPRSAEAIARAMLAAASR